MTPQLTGAELLSRVKDSGVSVAVIGIGVSNIPLIDYLLALGVPVTARDRKSAAELLPISVSLEGAGVKLVLGEDYLENLTEDVIFRSPGIRPDVPQIAAAAERGALVISEMELFFALCSACTVGVTGSDGKTTTTTLIYKILERVLLSAECGLQNDCEVAKVYVGGNIGVPLLPLAGVMSPRDFAVAELSSFQLQTMGISPRISVITNLSPNHLDWHRDMAEYAAAKANIFTRAAVDGSLPARLITNADCPAVMEMAAGAGVPMTLFSSEKHSRVEIIPPGLDCAAIYEDGGRIMYDDGITAEGVLEVGGIKLPGRHNLENYMAAIGAVYAAAEVRGLGRPALRRAAAEVAAEFGGVEHRCEFVREAGGIRFYNSSIDSSPTRTAAALSNFRGGSSYIAVICGGADKNIPFAPLAESLCTHAGAAVLTGTTAPAIKKAILDCPAYPGSGLRIIEAGFGRGGFREAVEAAARAAGAAELPPDVQRIVLLSPACASFDAFKNFEERGKFYKEIVCEYIVGQNKKA